jgi:hypothetical protein
MNLTGVFAPIPTPCDDRDRVDTVRLRAALARWVTRPLTGFVILGSNGEAVLMDDLESDQVIVAARESIPRDRRLLPAPVASPRRQPCAQRGARRNMAPTRCWSGLRVFSRRR